VCSTSELPRNSRLPVNFFAIDEYTGCFISSIDVMRVIFISFLENLHCNVQSCPSSEVVCSSETVLNFVCACVIEQSKAAENLKEMLYNAALEDNKKRHFTSAIHAHFREWLFGTVHLHGNQKFLLFSLLVYFFHFFLCPTNWVLVICSIWEHLSNLWLTTSRLRSKGHGLACAHPKSLFISGVCIWSSSLLLLGSQHQR